MKFVDDDDDDDDDDKYGGHTILSAITENPMCCTQTSWVCIIEPSRVIADRSLTLPE